MIQPGLWDYFRDKTKKIVVDVQSLEMELEKIKAVSRSR